jgi:hypothetical protein
MDVMVALAVWTAALAGGLAGYVLGRRGPGLELPGRERAREAAQRLRELVCRWRGHRWGPPAADLEAIARLHGVSSSSDRTCRRCGRTELPELESRMAAFRDAWRELERGMGRSVATFAEAWRRTLR